MQLTLSSILLSLAAFSTAASIPIARTTCAEAYRFGGVPSLSPSTVAPGASVEIQTDFTCAFYFGITPTYTDYYIEVLSNNSGYEPNILLARRQPNITASSPIDKFTVTIPDATYTSGANYTVVMDVTYPINGTNGTPVYVVGGLESAITIT
ncbi:hypothetical protein SERLA73DRAFT_152904 [Serpula lacrymans var. lacrymans S7.3]|uniref:Uncharacterized protein n=2 Tax=Serpula lacrymans var. lacrymans TaxID=341189 RepID=F8PWS3_SERL3|nr:uncharacterized protein SERLADRAFT_408649 [Serpula lacrymans var. lacrymans S7.9]EGN99250.1 hypothetical protein SERLA73DRAFT_152904 [Serpula lacrymans var. lacrymans S7.3]EGO24816.1 hypothetical protein SERLADRAFT_408649 [Serpula lacrymans var. lacrymans S7.9]